MNSRSHLSIGEVLSLLRQEFPDVTISKIRFLESQGLVDPERTPSGYRKFYEADVERLRWILRQQRENFLPLKVIKGRLDSSGSLLEDDDPPPAGAAESDSPDDKPADTRADGSPADESPADTRADRSPADGTAAASVYDGQPSEPASGRSEAVAQPAGDPPEEFSTPPRSPGGAGAQPARPAIFAGLARGDSRKPERGTSPPTARSAGTDDEQQDSYTAAELAAAAGCSPKLIADLTQFGLVGPLGQVGGTPYYDPCCLDICRAANRFAAFGVEPRHLRGWRTAAEREVEIFSQLVVPLLRQRNPKGRSEADEALGELAAAGAELRAAFVQKAISSIR